MTHSQGENISLNVEFSGNRTTTLNRDLLCTIFKPKIVLRLLSITRCWKTCALPDSRGVLLPGKHWISLTLLKLQIREPRARRGCQDGSVRNVFKRETETINIKLRNVIRYGFNI